MIEQTTETLPRDLRAELDGNPPAQKLAWALAIAERARDERWTPEEVARTLMMLGLDTLPPVHRALARHGHHAPRPTEAPSLEPVDNLMAAVLTVSLADKGDSSVLEVLEATEDSGERVDLLTGNGITPAMAAAYASLDATLLRQALDDPGGALDGIAARAAAPASGRPGSPGEAA